MPTKWETLGLVSSDKSSDIAFNPSVDICTTVNTVNTVKVDNPIVDGYYPSLRVVEDYPWMPVDDRFVISVDSAEENVFSLKSCRKRLTLKFSI